jgi:multiple sugar transport system permease protein
MLKSSDQSIGKSKLFGWAWRKRWVPYLLLLPIILMFCLLIIVPVAYEFGISFFQWGMLDWERPFVGLRNYVEAFRDPIFLRSLTNTLVYSLGVLPATLVIALMLALLVNQVRWKEFFRTVYFIPVVSSTVVVATVWKVMYQPEYGLLNQIFMLMGLPRMPWLTSPRTALFSIVIAAIWKNIGFYMVIYLAGLQTIPQMYYEAASLDGIGSWQRLRRITLPLLKPVLFFTTVIGLIGCLQVFDMVFIMSEQHQAHGGPANSTMVYALYIYEQAFRFLNMGYGAALAFIGFAAIVFLTYLQFRFTDQESLY